MRYLSVCSGIEAATVAWHPLGWEPAAFSEIDPFCRALLKHHYPGVPIHGDFTTIRGDEYGTIDVLVGGTPCQDFSIAGLRAGFTGDRGNLTLEFLRLVERTKPRWVVWENVPGVLSVDMGRAFGAFLGGLGELGLGFAHAVLDAQYFGLAQRRARVFVVAHLDWRCAAAVLFESPCGTWDSPPSRQASESVAAPIGGSSQTGGYRTTDLDHGAYIPEVMAHGQANAETATDQCPTLTQIHEAPIIAFGGNNTSGPLDVSTAVNAHGGPHGRLDFESETLVTHSLRADGFDASEDGTGRGTPMVVSVMPGSAKESEIAQPLMSINPSRSTNQGGDYVLEPTVYSIMPMNSSTDYKARETDIAQPVMAAGPVGGNQGGDYVLQPLPFDTTQLTSADNRSNPQPGDPCHSLAAEGHPPAIAFSVKDHGADATEELSPTLRSGGHDKTWANGGVMPAVASFQQNSMSGRGTLGYDPNTEVLRPIKPQPDHQFVAFDDVADPVAANQARTYSREGTHNFRMSNVAHTTAAVRRLTPQECERLQGFSDHYTLIPWRGKLAPDGPRYKSLGNSMAVPVMRWIGERIAMVEAVLAEKKK